VGCGGGSLGTTSTQPVTASAAGIWSGTDSATGLALSGLINPEGYAVFIRADGVQYSGTAQVTGSTLAASLAGVTQFPSQFTDGSGYGVGTLNASVVTGSALNGTLNFTTAANTVIASTWNLAFSSLYNSGSSLGSLAGTSGLYAESASSTDALHGAVLSINAQGVLFAQNPNDGCVLSGQALAKDPAADIYEVSYTYASCSGPYASLNGVHFTGLATLESNQSPAVLLMSVTGQSAAGVSSSLGLVSVLTAS
jgi:hypothetical protein